MLPFARRLVRTEHGIGLMEMLVVSAMLSILAVSLFGVIAMARTYRAKSERLGEAIQMLRFAATRFSEDIRHLTPGSWGCPDPTTLTFRDKSGQTVLEYFLRQDTGTTISLIRRRDLNGDGYIDPGTETEIVASNLWGDAMGALGTYFDCWVSQRQVMMWISILDPNQAVDPYDPPEQALYTLSVRSAVRI
jgi:type II secretory pathway pseudopilin PulG